MITPEQEEAYGKAMLALAKSEGHRKKPWHATQRTMSGYTPRAKDKIREFLTLAPESTIDVIAKYMGMAPKNTANHLCQLNRSGELLVERRYGERKRFYSILKGE